MAVNKKVVAEESAVVEQQVAPQDPWAKKVTINVPRATNGEGNYLIASVNSRTFKIQRGINVSVPAPIAEVLQHSFEAQDDAIRFIDSVSN